MKLIDRVAIVFGGTSGIGEATAKAYANEGAKVVVVGRDESKGNRILNELQGKSQKSIFAQADVSKNEEVQTVVNKTLEEFGQIDILYNGAGVHDAYKTAVELEEVEYEKLMDINVKGPYLASKAVIPHFLKMGKGVIINVGSQSTHVAGAGGSAYVTSKHAIEGFTKQLAYDFGRKGIKANCRAPDDRLSHRSYPLLAARDLIAQFIQEQRDGYQTAQDGDHHATHPPGDPAGAGLGQR